MRTDSTNLSDTAMQAIGQEITKLYGPRYHHARQYKTGRQLAQEAHEAIRPTYLENQNAGDTRDEQRLYDLIWKRAMASQMADAELEKTTVDIAVSTQPDALLQAEGEVLKFDGFLKVYLESTDDDEEESKGMLPPLQKGQALQLDHMDATERFTRPPARYTEASLVKKLEELGIGRPSTYAPTISKIMETNRGYVTKESREGETRTFQIFTLKNNAVTGKSGKEITGATKNVLYPSDIGMIVSDFLDQHFSKIMDYGFTAGIEERFDDIAEGKIEWAKMIDGFYQPFHQTVEKTIKEADRADGERILGTDPTTGRTVLVRISSLGKTAIRQPAPRPEPGNRHTGRCADRLRAAAYPGRLQRPGSVRQYRPLWPVCQIRRAVYLATQRRRPLRNHAGTRNRAHSCQTGSRQTGRVLRR
jgi:DNA topoisomerase-1